MNRILSSLIPIIFLCFPLQAQKSVEPLYRSFKNPPENQQLAVYWYWLSGNISVEGVIKDLHSMKSVGINRAFIGNIQADNIPVGSVKIFSEDWWKGIHAALKTAGELGIEIGIFNSPGWSQSGGPWVKASESMRYMGSKELEVEGGKYFEGVLPEVGLNAQDVKVLAYPVTANIRQFNGQLTKKKNEKGTIELNVSGKVQTLVIQTNKPVKTSATVYGKTGVGFTLLKSFEIDRSNTALNVGFIPLSPVVISVPSHESYRIAFDNAGEADFKVTLTTEPLTERYPEKTLAKMFPTPLPLWDAYLWGSQEEATEGVISAQNVLDITSHFADGKLRWDAPPGKWKVVRMAMVTTGVTNSPATPEATGLEIDKMSKKHVKSHFDAFIGEILRKIPAEDRKSFKVVVQDSYETGGQNWTDDMMERFEATYGYNPVPYLPVLSGAVVGSRDLSDRFLWDLRRLIADRVAYDYVGGLRDESHKHGLTTWLENYGHWGFPSEFMMYGGQSDEISGEYWSEGSLGDIENKAASSTAHVYGKTKIWAESFTAAGNEFGRYPYLMKQRGDRFFTEGINANLLHLFVHQPYEDKFPGMNAWFGNEFNRKNIWFEQMDVFGEYLKRCNLILQQGHYVADVAYFIGEDVPKMTGVTDPVLPKGYSFDYINAEILLSQSTVNEGKLRLKSGMEYAVLVLPKLKTMRPALLKKLSEMIYDGLVVLGPSPYASPSLQNYPKADREVKKMASELWKEVEPSDFQKRGKGYVFGSENTLENVFQKLKILPDLTIDQENLNIRFIHRRLEGSEIFFLSNQQESKAVFKAKFRVKGGVPYLWDAVSGRKKLLPEFTRDEGSIEIPLELASLESAFIVFDLSENSAKKGVNYPQGKVLQTLKSSWTVNYEGIDAPDSSMELGDWSTSTNPGLKYFSGKAIYENSFEFSDLSNLEVYLDLGKVMVMAKVFINDKYVGGAWTYPYRVHVSDFLKKGKNTVRVEVVNNWRNKLIGDKLLPEDQRKTWAPVNNLKADSPLQSSGLLGPVQLIAFDYGLKK